MTGITQGPWHLPDTLYMETTITRTLAEAERASLEAAAEAAAQGRINQREIAPGVWVLVPRESK